MLPCITVYFTLHCSLLSPSDTRPTYSRKNKTAALLRAVQSLAMGRGARPPHHLPPMATRPTTLSRRPKDTPTLAASATSPKWNRETCPSTLGANSSSTSRKCALVDAPRWLGLPSSDFKTAACECPPPHPYPKWRP